MVRAHRFPWAWGSLLLHPIMWAEDAADLCRVALNCSGVQFSAEHKLILEHQCMGNLSPFDNRSERVLDGKTPAAAIIVEANAVTSMETL